MSEYKLNDLDDHNQDTAQDATQNTAENNQTSSNAAAIEMPLNQSKNDDTVTVPKKEDSVITSVADTDETPMPPK